MIDGDIIATRWYTPGFGSPLVYYGARGLPVTIGAVLVNYPNYGYCQAYLGLAHGDSEKADALSIAEWGAKFEAAAARAIWPTQTQGLTFKEELPEERHV